MDYDLLDDTCMECMHDLHDHWQCKGGPEPTPDGDKHFPCSCQRAWYDYEKAGQRIVTVN